MAKIWKLHAVLLIVDAILRSEITIKAHAIGEVHSDLVVTKFGTDDAYENGNKDNSEEEPGWMVWN